MAVAGWLLLVGCQGGDQVALTLGGEPGWAGSMEALGAFPGEEVGQQRDAGAVA